MYDPAINAVRVFYNLSINGQFTTNIHPDSLTISYIAKALSNQSGFHVLTWAPPYSNWIPTAQNLSPDTLGYLTHAGIGSVNVTTKLVNESARGTLYNFSVSVNMNIILNWYPNSIHIFELRAQVNGLSEPVAAALDMSIVEMS